MLRKVIILGALSIAGMLVAAPSARVTLVACAPGYPGDTEQAQPSMDDLARGVAQAAGWDESRVAAVYYSTLDEGLERLSGAETMVALVPLPFYLEYRKRLDLKPLAQVVQLKSGEKEVWSVVARRGALREPSSLSGWDLAGMPGYSPRFVRDVALSGWGPLPDDLNVSFAPRVLSVLRKAAGGEPVAALLDRAQTAALDSLPFADELEVVASSAELPATLVCRVGGALDDDEARQLTDALLRLHESEGGSELLESIELTRFTVVDTEALGPLEEGF